jgi:hypothetical protein
MEESRSIYLHLAWNYQRSCSVLPQATGYREIWLGIQAAHDAMAKWDGVSSTLLASGGKLKHEIRRRSKLGSAWVLSFLFSHSFYY